MPLPSQGLQATRDAVLILLGPIFFRLFKAALENLLDGDVFPATDPLLDYGLPGVSVVTRLLFCGRDCVQLWRIKPSFLTCSEPLARFSPQVITITPEVSDVDDSALHRPESPPARFVLQVRIVVHSAGKDALPRRFNHAAAVGWSDSVNLARH